MRRLADWRIFAALAVLGVIISIALLVIVSFVQPGRDLLDKIDQQSRRSTCITDKRSALDLAMANTLIAALDRDQVAIARLRPELVVARDAIANLNSTCPTIGGKP